MQIFTENNEIYKIVQYKCSCSIKPKVHEYALCKIIKKII